MLLSVVIHAICVLQKMIVELNKTNVMSIYNALKFVRKVDDDDQFRRMCNKGGSKVAIHEMLFEHQMEFDEIDFNEAINIMLFKCQTDVQADGVKQVELWYSLL